MVTPAGSLTSALTQLRNIGSSTSALTQLRDIGSSVLITTVGMAQGLSAAQVKGLLHVAGDQQLFNEEHVAAYLVPGHETCAFLKSRARKEQRQ